MHIELIGDNSYILDDRNSCNNAGAACFGCPCFDTCPQHTEEDDA